MGNGYDKHQIETYPADIYALREYRVVDGELHSISTHMPNTTVNSKLLIEGYWSERATCAHYHVNTNNLTARTHLDHTKGLPVKECSCGYWAVWETQYLPTIRNPTRYGINTIITTVQAKGRIIIGSKGLRAEHLRIVGILNPISAIEISTNHLDDIWGYSTIQLEARVELERRLMRYGSADIIPGMRNIKAPVYNYLEDMAVDFPIANPKAFD